MVATITLTAVPGHLEKSNGSTVKVVEILGRQLGQFRQEIRTVADARHAVGAFGRSVRSAHPNASFAILVSVAKGGRKPAGYDIASRDGGLGQDDYMHVQEREAA